MGEDDETPKDPPATPPAEPIPTPTTSPLIEEAKKVNEEKARLIEEEKKLQDRKEKLHAEQMLGGQTQAGQNFKEDTEEEKRTKKESEEIINAFR